MTAPLYEALMDYAKNQIIPFHMPGHKQGRTFPGEYLVNLAKIDLTEVPGLDNLHNPEGPILEAQKLAAKAFGARESFFLVNGTTSGIYAAMYAVLNPDDKILIMRNSHKSVYNGLVLTGTVPVYINPEIDYEDGIPMGIDINKLEEYLKKDEAIKAVVMTYPNYYGFCSDITGISDIVHKYNKILIVDEAHGAHFPFSNNLPLSSIQAGADIVVQSVHKTLSSFTQSSILHLNSDRVDTNRLKYSLSLFQSTSPSYILMSSLDIARDYMEKEGKNRLEKAIILADYARYEINTIEGIRCLGKEIVGKYAIVDFDKTKLTISVKNLGIKGPEAEKFLRENFNIQVEMADTFNILAMVTLADDKEKVDLLIKGIKGLANVKKDKKTAEEVAAYPDTPEMVLKPSEAVRQKTKLISLEEAEGRVSADFIIPYPPGVPLICPGERIKKDMVKYINVLYNKGIKILGLKNNSLLVCEI
ncbi:lysine decarboxylase [Thermoanaerobacter thermohydrosulfuricus]|uniref:Arginine/lysine/ornithine decarboxylase n=4 Tax=Thermoanaerobacter TaxID=1754 RepID=I8R4F5_9THEO|nr:MULTISPECIES: aminotransferase class I/II-fold pyridoxal phosphate-dependent enzyme [Thermoanaerobacter]EGD52986.1 Orn/Lys/Arg decarboxylase major region [Thermoanaerobacter ethanolicus JW 200]AEM77612.1 Orn/Lys/Arg decarboxylase major region [Thermoanaerobacter wiegelii Rt8.B1]EIW00310.1 arginine/lysine/ornithine decarboxylase [Thermoanaerobacter siderophilus SR4]EMT38445.1 Arginine/lysine/ornithine decarboxylase [Thermoanaerobacter thermohydrosulfuricus WC1]UZQ83107.1 aminotransferase cla